MQHTTLVGVALGNHGRNMRLTAQILGEQETGLRQEVIRYEPQGPSPEECMLQMLYNDYQQGSG